MNHNFEWVSSLSFEEVPPPVGFFNIPRLSVSTKGVITMNRPLQEALDCSRRLRMKVSEDGRVIQLIPAENGELHFSSKGQLKHAEFLSILQRKGIQLPCRYTLEWWREQEIWVGCSEDLPRPPEMEMLPRKRKRKIS